MLRIVLLPVLLGALTLGTLAVVRRRCDPEHFHRPLTILGMVLLSIPLWYLPGFSANTGGGFGVARGAPFPVSVTLYANGRAVTPVFGVLWMVSWALDVWFLLELKWVVVFGWRRFCKKTRR